MFKHLFKRADPTPLLSSKLYNEQTFYPAFMNDLDRCKFEVVIESPFITRKRMNALYPSFRKLTKRGVRVVINTRDPREHDGRMRLEAEEAIAELQKIGVRSLYTNSHHRKLAILDRAILWEGSLNILSQNTSCEIMRRAESSRIAEQMIAFIKLDSFLR